MGREDNRRSIKDYIFQDTVLAPYKQFVDKKVRHIDQNGFKKKLYDQYKKGKLPKAHLKEHFKDDSDCSLSFSSADEE